MNFEIDGVVYVCTLEFLNSEEGRRKIKYYGAYSKRKGIRDLCVVF